MARRKRAGGNVSGKIDTLEPNSSEPLATLLASIVARISTHDSAQALFFFDTESGGDIAHQAQLAIAGVPLGIRRHANWANGTGALRSFVAKLAQSSLVHGANALLIVRSAVKCLRRVATELVCTGGRKLLQEVEQRGANARLRLGSIERSQRIGISAIAAVALGLSFMIVQLSGGAWRVASRDATAVPAQPDASSAVQVAEERPPAAADGEFARANIRYCTFQQIRLEALGPITEGADLVVFNALVEDWNARCTKYRYHAADKEAIDAEAGRRRALLEVEGRALMNSWRRKIVTTVQQRPVPAVLDAGAVPTQAAVASERASEAAEPLPLLITLGRAAPDDSERDTGLSLRTPALALLRADVAVRVQRRLNDLGYTIAPLDGTWGTMSRGALRRFKKANGLLVNDAFDAETVTRLFSTAAVTAAAAGPSDDETATIETIYPPPPAAGLNPLNRADGQRVQQRLMELGYYPGRGDGSWGAASRTALRSFKAANGLPADEEWNAMAEAVLFDEHAVHAGDAPAAAPRAAVAPSAAPAVPLPPKRPPPPAKTAEPRPSGFFQAVSRLFGTSTHASP
jgi:peptidoglycan hydrolase-like protein with peptidoglycan-binding domain